MLYQWINEQENSKNMTAVDKYIFGIEDEAVQERMMLLRDIFLHEVPNVQECIRYQMPAYQIGKGYLYLAAYKKHIGIHAIDGLESIEEEIAPYRAKNTRDTLHFLHKNPLPIELVQKIIQAKYGNI